MKWLRNKRSKTEPADPSTDRMTALFEASLDGDENAYREFLQHTALIVRKFLSRAVQGEFRSEAHLEDLVQEVLITVHRKRGLYQRGKPVLPWLKVITKYRLIDSLRANQRRPQFVEFDESFEAIADEQRMGSEATPDIEELMAPLSGQQREVLKLAKLEGLSHAEIASRLGMSVAAVKVSVHRSLNLMRKTVDEKE